ncbi:CG0192-related protein [Lacisediminihabitans sp. FW035]
MALLHRAELRPSKIELISAWAPTQPWFTGSETSVLTNLASFRFDDPDGEVGVETIIVGVDDGTVLQIPLTYRGAPLAENAGSLIGTTEHSVLGRRWVYDGTGDPVYLAAVVVTALTGGIQADEYFEVDGERVGRESSAHVVGTGRAGGAVPELVGEISPRHGIGTTEIESGGLRIVLARVLDPAVTPVAGAKHSITGTWAGQGEPRPLVWVSVD